MYYIGQIVLRTCNKCGISKINCLGSRLQYDIINGKMCNMNDTLYNKHCECEKTNYTLIPFNYSKINN